jgi:toxin ParE1/3/4
MAQVIWAEPALNDLDAIADYIALDNPAAASELVQRIFGHVDQLIIHPDSGSKPRELRGGRYRQIVEPPCRIFYRREGETVYVLRAMRGERKLRPRVLAARSKKGRAIDSRHDPLIRAHFATGVRFRIFLQARNRLPQVISRDV